MGNQASITNSQPADYRALPLSTMEDIVARFKERVETANWRARPTRKRSGRPCIERVRSVAPCG